MTSRFLQLSLTKILCSLWRMSFPSTGPRSSSSLRPWFNLMNDIRRCTRVRGSTVQTLISKGQGGAARSMVDSGAFRQLVFRSGDAVHRPAALPRRIPFPAAESLLARVSPSPTKGGFAKGGFAIGDSNRNTNGAAPVGITPLHFDDRSDEFCTRSFRAGLPTAIR
jgi:hypothetical protein